MITVFILVTACLALLTGLGLPLARKLDQPVPETLFAAFLAGWGLAIAGLQIWHLALPANGLALAALAAASLAGWALYARPLAAWLRAQKSAPRRTQVLVGGLGLLILGLLVNQALHSPSSYDHGLYHLPMVRWLQAYRIVPGLGNLHHRFAFNNASFLLVAALDSGPWRGLTYYTATTAIYAALALRGLLGAYRAARGSRSQREALYALLLPVTLWMAFRPEFEFAGYSTDAAVFFLQAALAAELLHAFEAADRPRPSRAVTLALLVFSAAVGLAVKASFAVFGLGMGLAALWTWAGGPRPTRREAVSALSRAVTLALLVLVPWLARHALLSGYLLYPLTTFRLELPWMMPAAMADPIAGVISEWARHGYHMPVGTPFQEWFVWWLPRQMIEFRQSVPLAAGLLLLSLVLGRLPKARGVQRRGPLALLIITAAGLAFWFTAAPSLRFSAALPWLLPLIPLVMLVDQLRELEWLPAPEALPLLALLLVILWLQPRPTRNLSRAWFIVPPTEFELAARQRMYDPLRSAVTNSGLTVYLAADEHEELCFDQPLPCTRVNDFDPRLSLLHPGQLGDGFYMDLRP